MAHGYWLQYAKNPGGAGCRYPQYQFISAIPGDSGRKPQGFRATQIYEYKWVSHNAIHNAKGEMIVASKVDYVRPSDGRIVDGGGAEIDLSLRAWVSVRVAGFDHHVLQHDGKALIARVGSGPIEVL